MNVVRQTINNFIVKLQCAALLKSEHIIPLRFTRGTVRTYIFQFATILQYESHYPLRFASGIVQLTNIAALRLQYLSFTTILFSTYHHRHRFSLRRSLPEHQAQSRALFSLLFARNIHDTIHEQ